ncbi:MAG: TonB-dependent receptor [Acidobacteria bacterium]|nr:TonB-dependent receptor [Acidobacteriota bacterium]
MWARVAASVIASALAVSGVATAQGVQTGELVGTVTDQQNLVVPGAIVSVVSPALQGTRSTITEANGDYILRALPPGVYRVRVELQGFQTAEETVVVQLGGTVRFDPVLQPGGVTEVVEVTASTPGPLAAPRVGVNYRNEEIAALPNLRTPSYIAELAPGLSSGDTTPNTSATAQQVTIAGAFAYDNVFLIDGVDINDNLFGYPNNLFIEDAIEETQVLTAGIPAEYGRFSGGVINAITKSGGNVFSGTFRTNLARPSWTEETPFEKSRGTRRGDKLSKNFEYTAGGPIVTDRLWFFGAGRNQRTTGSDTFRETGIPFDTSETNNRYQFKLTGQVVSGHTVQGSFIDNPRKNERATFGFTIHPSGLITPELPNRGVVANYKGVVRSNALAEVQVSRKTWEVTQSGGTNTDIVNSPFLTLTQTLGHYNAPYFDSSDPESRNNNQITGSLSYFLSTASYGSHDIKGGVERFVTTRSGGNSQSATGWVFYADYKTDAAGRPILDGQQQLIPTFVPGATLIENWIPTRGATIDIRTLSFYLQDQWRASTRWTFNAGMRVEAVRSDATGNIVTVDTTTVVPRLAASYDVRGDGRLVLQSTYGHYAGKYSEAQFARNTNVGIPDFLGGTYIGPPGEGRSFAPGFDPANYRIVNGRFPTANVFVDDDLSSPIAREFTLAAGTELGPRGHAKATYVWRDTENFVEDFITLENGVTPVVRDGRNFGTFTNVIMRNSDVPERRYQALLFDSRYTVSDDITISGHWTVELKNEGNFEGEATNQPGISSVIHDFPEIYSEARHYPFGRLDNFQRHKIRLWALYNLDLGWAGSLSVAPLWRYNSALTYSLAAANQPLTAIQRARAATYPNLPSSQTVFFGERGSEEFEGYGLVDVGLQYEIPVWRTLRPWVKFDTYNVFNNDKLIAWNTVVRQDPNAPADELGLRTGYTKGPLFGQGTATTHYPRWLPGENGGRTFRLAFGLRF